MKNIKKNLLILLPLVCILLGCSSNEGYAPKRIKGYEIEAINTTADSLDKSWIGELTYYTFHPDDTYKLTGKGKIIETGEYSYRKTERNKSQAVLTYSYKGDANIYTIFFEFTDSKSGTWKVHYPDSFKDAESGTFKITKIP